MKIERTIGGLIITGAIAVFIPYTILTIIFDYPVILRQDTANILTTFHEGGSRLIWTWFGVIGLIVQMIGLLRWTFVVPVLANTFIQATDESTKAAAIVAFKTIHQFAGVILGEYLGQLFTIVWTVLISLTLAKLKLIPKWMGWLGYIGSFIYLLAQAELFATVIPGFPVWSMPGFIGSTLWLIWLIIIGTRFLKMEIEQ